MDIKPVNNAFYFSQRDDQTLDDYEKVLIYQLFTEYYFNYHYIHSLFDNSRIHFLAFEGGKLVGYGGIKKCDGLAILSNLLVRAEYQSLGIGKQLEINRFHYSRVNNLINYSSCVMDGVQSQWLKYSNGMIPINVKYGYRSSVVHSTHIGGAVTFLGKNSTFTAPSENALYVEKKIKRMRLLIRQRDYLIENLPRIRKYDDWYIDVVCGRESINNEVSDMEDFSYQGFDLLNENRCGGKMYQYKNRRFFKGYHASNIMIFGIKDILDFSKLCNRR